MPGGMSLKKSFFRAMEWRALTILIDFAIAYALTRKVTLSLGLCITSSLVKIGANVLWLKYRL